MQLVLILNSNDADGLNIVIKVTTIVNFHLEQTEWTEAIDLSLHETSELDDTASNTKSLNMTVITLQVIQWQLMRSLGFLY